MFSKLSNTVACVSLSAALIGCREKRVATDIEQRPSATEPTIVSSMPEARRGAEGSRVYLTNVTLKPVTAPSNRIDEAHYEVSDAQGERMKGVLNAPADSFLWKLAPFGGARVYTDFGATIDTREGKPVLSIFKLAN